jgi:hypothetical protein
VAGEFKYISNRKDSIMKFKKSITFMTILILLSSAFTVFSYTRDYDVTDPVDHSLNSTWPAEIREVMVDISERLDDIMNGFTSGDTVTDFNVVPINNRASAPAAVADTLQLYSKDVSSKAELYAQDEDSNEIQITTAGSINAAALSSTMSSGLFDKIWPVGSIFISTSSTNPGTSLGFGTWSAFGAGKVLISLDSGDTDFDTAEETGGSKTHTLSTAEIPAHTHTVPFGTSTGGSDLPQEGASNDSLQTTRTSSSVGSGTAFSVMNPYIAVYIFKRDS